MSDREAILFANEAFYQAFADRDMDAMEALWAARDDLTCTHPGWPPLIGRRQVLQSWLSILANPESPAVSCHGASAHQAGDVAYVLCYERIDGNVLAATNVFVRDGKRWRLMHHQAGPTSGAPEEDETPARSVN
tara:strand:- start:1940 stop:2341 length:402 start_codon:yes stop_codon:yes gene_type:complete